jgi:hypothetical protein
MATELMERQDAELPALIRDAGTAARFAFEEFLHGKIRNRFTRKAYLHAVKTVLGVGVRNGNWIWFEWLRRMLADIWMP